MYCLFPKRRTKKLSESVFNVFLSSFNRRRHRATMQDAQSIKQETTFTSVQTTQKDKTETPRRDPTSPVRARHAYSN